MSTAPALGPPALPQPIDLDAAGGDDARAYELIAQGARTGLAGALLTLVHISGSAPRPLGTHMAVLSDGRYCGYVSGSCAEAAIAREALAMIDCGSGATIRLGRGSPWIDLPLPCGGGLSLAVLVRPPQPFIASVRALLADRRSFSVSLGDRPGVDVGPLRTGWQGDVFHRAYRPEPRLLVIGAGREALTLVRLACAAGLDVHLHTPDRESLACAMTEGAQASHRRDLGGALPIEIDDRTAIVLMDHDAEREEAVLREALVSEAFYIGALGSLRTHALRKERLARAGIHADTIARIKAPIGLVPRARDARTLAVSILAEIATEAAVEAGCAA